MNKKTLPIVIQWTVIKEHIAKSADKFYSVSIYETHCFRGDKTMYAPGDPYNLVDILQKADAGDVRAMVDAVLIMIAEGFVGRDADPDITCRTDCARRSRF